MNHAVEKQLIRARTALYIEFPFYGVLALRLTMKEDFSIPTMCVSHKHIYYNPDYVAKLSPELTRSAVAHEVGHIFLDHINRCNGRHPKKWNAACDYVLNDMLKTDGHPLAADWLHNPAFAGMTSDHVYTLLPDQPDGPGDGGWGAQDDMQPGGDPTEREQDALDWKLAAVAAAQIAKQAGKLPASLKRFLDDVAGNKVNWKERLRRFVTQHAKADYSWTRPNRRMMAFGHYLPSLHSEAMGLLVNAIDTSGSIDAYTLNMFGAEVLAARAAAQPEKMINIYCDAAIDHVDEYDIHDAVKFELHGGGGTDFNPPFEHVEEHNLKPACLIYLTDGYGPFPPAPPPYPVLWVMTSDVIAPWGETIRIEA